jgi:hypothetical protein
MAGSVCPLGSRLKSAPAGATNRLYKNSRHGAFTDVTEQAGLHRAGWASADLEVRWPWGLKQTFADLSVDRIIVVEEGAKAPK